MAYSLNDPYRGLRLVLRIDASLVGLVLGGSLLFAPQFLHTLWTNSEMNSFWMWRLGGAGLVAMGLSFLELSTRPAISPSSAFSVMLANGVLGVVLFQAYVSGAVNPPQIWGRLTLLALFLCNLTCVILPWAYLGEDLKP